MGNELWQIQSDGRNPSKSRIRTDDRWLYCPVCDRYEIVHFPSYSKKEKRLVPGNFNSGWFPQECDHWDSHEWEEFLYSDTYANT